MLVKAFISGIIGSVIGFLSTYVVSLFIPTSNLSWALIATTIASFCAAFSGFIEGWRQKSNLIEKNVS